MQQRKSGRPSGTDGSDFSYRMVVDSRYKKVAKGKSRLYRLILVQAVIQLIGLFGVILSISKENSPNIPAISSSASGLMSLLIGELGRRWSRVSFLRVYMLVSSIAIFISVFCAVTSNSKLEIIQNLSGWKAKKFEVIEIFSPLVGLPVQILLLSTVISLIGNMSPPKKAS